LSAGPADPASRAYELLSEGKTAEALKLIEPIARRAEASHGDLVAYAEALKTEKRIDEALRVYKRALAIAPKSGVAEHNLAALQGDLGQHAEAEAGARRAFAKGLDAPETWIVLARALQGQGRHDEAIAAYREALCRRPTMPDAHRDLAQLIWMLTEDAAAATAELRAAMRQNPADPGLAIQLAAALSAAGQDEPAYEALLSVIGRQAAPLPALEVAASAAAAALKETVAAQRHAERAVQASPDDPQAQMALVDAHLGMGRPGPAARMAEALHARMPDEQQVISRLATAWRLMDDPRYRALYDYDAMVLGWMIDTPPGWATLQAYLADLAAALRRAHAFKAHPFAQSLRFGAQTQTDLGRIEDPAIQAFFTAIEGPIRRHMEAIGQGSDPLRRRNTGRYAIQGAWSVRLRPQGFHLDHVHSRGWLSSACHIVLPGATRAGGREGWLKFGEPGIATQPALPAERFVEPEPGRLVLFPSYMWHGTTPFSGQDERLTVAFDVIPA
jgi:tetratricopeptide (TPR) repeat protein